MTTPPTATAVAVSSVALNGAATITSNISDTTTRVITALWRTVDAYDPKQVDDFKAKAGQIIVSSQRSVATAHTAAQLMQLRAVGINQNPAVKIPDNVRGQSVTFGPKKATVHAAREVAVEYQEPAKPSESAKLEKPKTVEQTVTRTAAEPDQIFERAAETYRYEKSAGADDTEANAAAEERIAGLVDGNLILAQRLAEQQTLSQVKDLDKRLVGYRRVIHPELSKGGVCGLCIAAASRQYHIGILKPIHERCKCSIAPITTEHDIGELLNTEDLDKLYDQAGESTYGKDLKRNRYVLEHHNELGPVLRKVKGEKLPYYSTTKPVAPKQVESKADVAKRLLPGLEGSLADLRAKGLADNSPQIAYHVSQIARLNRDLANA